MSKIVYYLLIVPLSRLPLQVLYVLSDIIFFLAYRVLKYRRDIVWSNVRNSFPSKSEEDIKHIVKGFYRHFSDLIIESLKIFSITKEEAIDHCKVVNPEVLDELYAKGKQAILVGGHYNNWEIAALILNAQIKHQIAGIYTPLTNPFFENKFKSSRSKYGTHLVPKNKVNAHFKKEHADLNITVFGADQSPTFIRKNTYWTNFLNQDTAVMFGTEKFAVEYDLPVVFLSISKVKRGYYQMSFTMLEEHPIESDYCSITEKHTRMLEKQILEHPEFYLWTHKRWKHKRKN